MENYLKKKTPNATTKSEKIFNVGTYKGRTECLSLIKINNSSKLKKFLEERHYCGI